MTDSPGFSRHLLRNSSGESFQSHGAGTAHICTLLTKDYLLQGLALYYSLKRHAPAFRLWVLCVDGTAYRLLEKLNLADVTLLSLEGLKTERLAGIERQRRLHEFCWTLKAPLISYLFAQNRQVRSLLYLDADLFFFQELQPIYREWGDRSIYLTSLWLAPKWQKKSGKYSAGLIGFKRDQTGLRCLRLWQKKCFQWCFDRRERGLWADQKYLDAWPKLFPQVIVSRNKGINAGPWSIKTGAVRSKGGAIYLDGRELICYHFSGFQILSEFEFELCNRRRLPAQSAGIYSVYAGEIRKALARVQSVDSAFGQNPGGGRRSRLFNYYSVTPVQPEVGHG